MNEFNTIKEAFTGFRRTAVSDLTPPKISRALEGAFYAGAQASIVLLAERLGINPVTASKEVIELFSEIQTYFITAKAEATSRIEEARRGKN